MSELNNRRPVELITPQEEENVTASDFEKAITNLQRFATEDVEKIRSLDDLSFQMIFVGIGLRTVLVSTGQLKEDTYTIRHPVMGKVEKVRRWHAIDKLLVDGSNIYADTNSGTIRVQKSQQTADLKVLDFDIKIPFRETIRTGTLEHNLYIAHAVDFRSESKGSYYPAHLYDNADVLQGYARVAQEGVKDILSVVPPPTILPSLLKSK
jgi:hypothetical protein